MATNQTMTQDELGDILDEFAYHWPHRHVIERTNTWSNGALFTAVDGSQCSIDLTDTFDAAFDRVANWSRALATEAKRERSCFAAFESAALGEW